MNRTKTLQVLPEDVYDFMKRSHAYGGDEYLVMNGISHTLSPLKICPVKIYGTEMAVGLFRDRETMTFYLFDKPNPHVDFGKNKRIVMQFQGGKNEGIGSAAKYKNVLLKRDSQRTVNVKENHALAFSVVWGEIAKLIATDEYFKDEVVDPKYVREFTPYNPSDFEVVHNIPATQLN